MSLKAKIFLGVVVAVLVTAAVTGIAYFSTQFEKQGEEPGLYVGGERVEDPGVMMKVGEHEIGFDEYRYFYLMNTSYIEQNYGENAWETDYDGSMEMNVRKGTEEAIVSMYAWLEVAQQEGIALTDEEKQEILDTMAEQKETLGEEGFAQNLKDMFFTSEEMYLQITQAQRLVQKTQEELGESMTTEIEENMDEYLATAKHILISFDNPTAEPQAQPTDEEELLDAIGEAAGATGETEGTDSAAGEEGQSASEQDVRQSDVQEEIEPVDGTEEAAEAESDTSEAPALSEEEAEELAKERAEDLEAILRDAEASGADIEVLFDEMMWAYGQDGGVESNPDGYTFGKGEVAEEFYQAAIALEPGEFSEPIKTDFGYHIIMRLPLNEDAIEDIDAKIANMVNQQMGTLLTEARDAMPVEYGAYYSEVSPQSIK
ncbi:peptidylprolyl isomerase [Ruminococcaceae bacterium OttesenSCG-928-I18]|nr:peptidylprolyl isomerase [Ruminococcaceae bacterium OttesenSCG-928-I18]